MNSYGKQTVRNKDIDAAVEALSSDMLTQGSQVERLEEELAEYCGARYAVLCCNGTAALWLAYKAANIREWTTALVPTISFVATANMVEMHRASVRFADTDEWGMLSTATQWPSVDMVVPVHMRGSSCDMAAIWRKWGKGGVIVEDACHALGAEYCGKKVGSCEFSDMCVFSFHAVKSITTGGEGGAITTNNRSVYESLLQYRNHGFEPGTHEQTGLGFNFRMTEVQAAFGRMQLRDLDGFIERRREIAEKYTRALDGWVRMPIFDEKSSHHIFVIRTARRDELKLKLKNMGVGTQIHYRPIHMQPYWLGGGEILPNAEQYARECLTLPCYPTLTNTEQNTVIDAVKESLA